MRLTPLQIKILKSLWIPGLFLVLINFLNVTFNKVDIELLNTEDDPYSPLITIVVHYTTILVTICWPVLFYKKISRNLLFIFVFIVSLALFLVVDEYVKLPDILFFILSQLFSLFAVAGLLYGIIIKTSWKKAWIYYIVGFLCNKLAYAAILGMAESIDMIHSVIWGNYNILFPGNYFQTYQFQHQLQSLHFLINPFLFYLFLILADKLSSREGYRELKENLFSIHGKLKYTVFMNTFIILYTLIVLLGFFFNGENFSEYFEKDLWLVLYRVLTSGIVMLFYFLIIYVFGLIVINRLFTTLRPVSWWFFLLLIPVINIVPIIILKSKVRQEPKSWLGYEIKMDRARQAFLGVYIILILISKTAKLIQLKEIEEYRNFILPEKIWYTYIFYFIAQFICILMLYFSQYVLFILITLTVVCDIYIYNLINSGAEGINISQLVITSGGFVLLAFMLVPEHALFTGTRLSEIFNNIRSVNSTKD